MHTYLKKNSKKVKIVGHKLKEIDYLQQIIFLMPVIYISKTML